MTWLQTNANHLSTEAAAEILTTLKPRNNARQDVQTMVSGNVRMLAVTCGMHYMNIKHLEGHWQLFLLNWYGVYEILCVALC